MKCSFTEDSEKMYRHDGSFKAFAERELRDYLEENDREIRSRIERESENYILNVNETEYVNYLVNEFTVDMPNIDFASKSVTSGMTD